MKIVPAIVIAASVFIAALVVPSQSEAAARKAIDRNPSIGTPSKPSLPSRHVPVRTAPDTFRKVIR